MPRDAPVTIATRPVSGLAGRELLVQGAGVLARRVGGVPDEQVGFGGCGSCGGFGVAGLDDDALVAGGVPGGRDDLEAWQDLGVA